jgi:hypothetical protein
MTLGGLGWAPALIIGATAGTAIGTFVGAAVVRSCRRAWYVAAWDEGFDDGQCVAAECLGHVGREDVADPPPLVVAEPLARLLPANPVNDISDGVVIPFHRRSPSSPRQTVVRLSPATVTPVTGNQGANLP